MKTVIGYRPTGRARWLALLAAVLLASAACTPPPPAADVVIENVTVIDPVSGAETGRRVVIHGERIIAVTDTADPAPEAAVVIDGAGRYLIPGLWDMHVHFLYDEALTEAMPALFLRYGITSVRDTGGDMARLAAMREAIRASGQPAPRIFLSGPLLDGRFVVYDGGDPGRPPLGIDVSAAAMAEQRVAALAEAGADFIKIYELVSPDVFQALVDAARAHGLPIAAHVPLTLTADQAGPLVDSMEHLRNVELACAAGWAALLEARRERIAAFEEGRGFDLRAGLHASQRLPAIADYDQARCDAVLASLRDTIQVPTLRLNAFDIARPYLRDDWPTALAGLPAPVAAAWRGAMEAARSRPAPDLTFAEWSLFLVGRMQQAGVPIGAGTDTPITLAIPGYSLHTELALLVQSGLTPLQALHAATVIPARFFGLEDTMGRIASGMAADLVLLDADPLADIEHSRRIHGVMSRGRWLPAAAQSPGATALRLDAGPGSAQPRLGSDGDSVVLSWLQPVSGGSALHYAVLGSDGWEAPRTLRSGDDWFVNWADFPSVTPMGAGLWAAHWLVKQPGGPYAYDVVMAVSTDAGATWSDDVPVHDDGTPTEHGFVSLFPWQSGAGALWLDGRETGAPGGAMTLRAAVVGADGGVRHSVRVDERVCDCCATAVAVAASGPVAVYRDRSAGEIRDIAVVRAIDGVWEAPRSVAEDGWHIAGCPVNGPAIAADGDRVAVAWFTAAEQRARVRVAFSADSGATFGTPLEVAAGDVSGQVAVALDEDGHAFVSWLEGSVRLAEAGAMELRVSRVTPESGAGPSHLIARTGAGRPAGVPQMLRHGAHLLFAWSDTREADSQVRSARVSADQVR